MYICLYKEKSHACTSPRLHLPHSDQDSTLATLRVSARARHVMQSKRRQGKFAQPPTSLSHPPPLSSRPLVPCGRRVALVQCRPPHPLLLPLPLPLPSRLSPSPLPSSLLLILSNCLVFPFLAHSNPASARLRLSPTPSSTLKLQCPDAREEMMRSSSPFLAMRKSPKRSKSSNKSQCVTY